MPHPGILQGDGGRHTPASTKGIGGRPTPAFWEKRLQALENKENECRKERKETTKRLQATERT